ncbi:hypothetical protein J2Z69_002427 [Paenibacillus shirakamiensis]|uniref:SMI1/KNR4 family protein n=1 Tax=Paenibacillus shirakamiensis TaxID=1265935 RepID=A0ABS4JI36_9BACL|nr:SMI1/KNR4 family protein [Paenibacillus shirakamiensis]MBP2001384.1 hypothetical protein [Paenibacillus shirakamiensis]
MEQARELIITRKPGLEENDIIIAETLLKVQFPDKYRELVKLVNQAEIDEWIFYPIKDSKRIAKTSDDIVRNNTLVNYSNITEKMIWIGEDGTGDLIGYKMNENGHLNEEIYHFNHESQEIILVYDDIEDMIMELLV